MRRISKMKNSNNIQDIKFEKQVNHLQNFIGMPMWNGRNPSLSEIREYDRRILEKQALGFEPKRKGLLKRVFIWAIKIVIKAFNQSAKTSVKKREYLKPIKTGVECCG